MVEVSEVVNVATNWLLFFIFRQSMCRKLNPHSLLILEGR